MELNRCPNIVFSKDDIIQGFTINGITPLSDINTVAYEMYHKQSGAQLIYLHTSDSENLFPVGVLFLVVRVLSEGALPPGDEPFREEGEKVNTQDPPRIGPQDGFLETEPELKDGQGEGHGELHRTGENRNEYLQGQRHRIKPSSAKLK